MARRDDNAVIVAHDLSVAHADGDRVVDGVTFELSPGGTTVIMGPTGAGKSSLVELLAGSRAHGLTVAGGEARVLGIPLRRPGRARRRLTYSVGYLAQGAGARLPARMTVAELIGEPITSRERHVNARALAVMTATLLDEMMLPLGAAPKYPYELSAGMRQRVAFARALVLQPKLFVADDPLANLDPEVRRVVRDAIDARRRQYQMASLIVSNDQNLARELGAETIVLRGGHIVAQGPADDLMWTPDADTDPRLIAS